MTSQIEEEVVRTMDAITKEAFKSGKPSIGRLATVQSIVDLGEGWHNYREIQNRLQTYLVTGSTFSFQLVARYPKVFERNGDEVRVSPLAFRFVAKQIKPRLRKAKNVLAASKE